MEASGDFDDLKVIDFGLAVDAKLDEELTSMTGSKYYMSPQVLQGNYTSKADIWSTVIVAAQLSPGPSATCPDSLPAANRN